MVFLKIFASTNRFLLVHDSKVETPETHGFNDVTHRGIFPVSENDVLKKTATNLMFFHFQTGEVFRCLFSEFC